jgi:hypothetical protein
MPDGLYDRDILAWSEHQAELLRRLGRGEKVNDIDWQHVIEEIEDVGQSEFRSVKSQIVNIMVHVLKLYLWHGSTAVQHWQDEIGNFQDQAKDRLTAAMRDKIVIAELYARSLRRILIANEGGPPLPEWPAACPFTLDDLIDETPGALVNRVATAMPKPPQRA